jgi:uncharacterized protein (DUF2267 family)
MQYGEFLKKVQDRIGPTQGSAASDEASGAIAATLEALGECITGEEARNLADQLPKEIRNRSSRQAKTPKSARWRPSCGASARRRASTLA